VFPHNEQGESSAVSRAEVPEELEEEAGKIDAEGAFMVGISEDEGGESAVRRIFERIKALFFPKQCKLILAAIYLGEQIDLFVSYDEGDSENPTKKEIAKWCNCNKEQVFVLKECVVPTKFARELNNRLEFKEI
jgi:hypothetical protein